jgi:RNA:NAD 2'-phosphotransferase (TPT1/KptA family)
VYHGTSEETWALIQKEGILLGRRSPEVLKEFPDASRMTYLAAEAQEAAMYGDVILEIDLGVRLIKAGFWQTRVYEPIPIWSRQPIPIQLVRRLSPEECAPLFKERARIRAQSGSTET